MGPGPGPGPGRAFSASIAQVGLDWAREHAVTFGVSMGPEGSADRWVRQRRFFRRGTGSLYRKLQSIKFLLTRDLAATASFLAARYPRELPLEKKIELLLAFTRTTNAVRGYHTLAEILTACDRIFRVAP